MLRCRPLSLFLSKMGSEQRVKGPLEPFSIFFFCSRAKGASQREKTEEIPLSLSRACPAAAPTRNCCRSLSWLLTSIPAPLSLSADPEGLGSPGPRRQTLPPREHWNRRRRRHHGRRCRLRFLPRRDALVFPSTRRKHTLAHSAHRLRSSRGRFICIEPTVRSPQRVLALTPPPHQQRHHHQRQMPTTTTLMNPSTPSSRRRLSPLPLWGSTAKFVTRSGQPG